MIGFTGLVIKCNFFNVADLIQIQIAYPNIFIFIFLLNSFQFYQTFQPLLFGFLDMLILLSGILFALSSSLILIRFLELSLGSSFFSVALPGLPSLGWEPLLCV